MDHPLPAYMNHIDLDYRPIHKTAQELQNSFHARIEDPYHPFASIAKRHADELVADIAANKHPKDIEERISAIQTQLVRSRDSEDTPLFNAENLEYFRRKYNQLRREIQEQPRYNKPRTLNAVDPSKTDPRSVNKQGNPYNGFRNY